MLSAGCSNTEGNLSIANRPFKNPAYDALVVGSGPNGLAAAITLAQAGCSVLVFEAKETIGGGMRSAELTLPGFVHDICSAIHPLGLGSPFFRHLPLADYGLTWLYPPTPLAHPLDNRVVMLEQSVEATMANLERDGAAYRRLMVPLVADWDKLALDLLGPFPFPPHHPLALARFGLSALRSARGLAESLFKGEQARALLAGLAAHSMMPLEQPPTAAIALVLGIMGHALGWPLPQGGSQRLADALAAYLRFLGGKIVTHTPIESLEALPSSRLVLFDIAPRQFLRLAGDRLPPGYRCQLKNYRYGPGVFKIDWALDGPIPWQAGGCVRAGTVHIGGTLPEIAAAERAVWQGQHPEKPFVLLVQPSLFDPTRAPVGQHTAWAYCHVPSGSTFDMTSRVETQIERFAPGFRECILARHAMSPLQMEQYNPNYVGGDINSGVQDFRQLFTRPTLRWWAPYSTPLKGFYLCSSSTPPGGGVHGMCGYHAAKAALRGL